jgi:hypothetical protein
VFRVLFYLISAIVLISVLRGVIGFLASLFSQAAFGTGRRAPVSKPPAQSPTHSHTLKRDPVCGTFVPTSTNEQIERNGETYYFCSAACRAKF